VDWIGRAADPLYDLKADAGALLLQQSHLQQDLLPSTVVACEVRAAFSAPCPGNVVLFTSRTLSAAVLDDRLEESNLLVDASNATVRPALQAMPAANLLEHRGANIC